MTDFYDPAYYWNRELSWLDFNQRILEEARDKRNLLFERLKFLSITSSNLDEFFMVRVASIKDMIHAEYKKRDIAGMTPEEQLAAIQKKTHEMVNQQYSTYQRSLLRELRDNGLRVIASYDELREGEAEFLDRYFKENVYPVLTPMAYDSSRPFPLVLNKTLNIAALVRPKKPTKEQGSKPDFAMVQVPSVLSRIIELPARTEEGKVTERSVILLETVIEKNIHQLFSNYDVLCTSPFRIMRNADFTLDEEEAQDLLEEISKQLKKRRRGEVIRLEIEEKPDKKLLKILKEELEVSNEDIYEIGGPLDLTFLMKMYGLPGFEHLKDPKYTPQPVPELMNDKDIFTNIRERDIFLHHPYETFDPVVNFVRTAARDSQVLAIKQTLYRVSSTSPIIAALEEAAGNGKQVTVLVELKARFDEENNIIWAKRLEKAGCHVIYGLLGVIILNPLMYKLELIIFKGSETHQFTGGANLISAVLVLALMILPTVINISETSLRAVPSHLKSASLALGATHIQTIFKVIVPAAKSGIITAIVLGIGRAIGEAMAITLVSGSSVNIPLPFNSVRFLTTAIVAEMGYASGLHRQVLFTIGLVLFAFIMIINISLTRLLKKEAENE